jgi:hypothetical protein
MFANFGNLLGVACLTYHNMVKPFQLLLLDNSIYVRMVPTYEPNSINPALLYHLANKLLSRIYITDETLSTLFVL